MGIIILIIWILMGVLAHIKIRRVAILEDKIDAVDAFGIFLVYLLAPYWVLRTVWYKVIIGSWE